MKTIAFFNNKGGVGKTSLVYHLAWMYSDLGLRVLAADLDPQANLTSMFLDEDGLESLWPEGTPGRTILAPLLPLLEGEGGIADPHVEDIAGIGLLAGDLALSGFEDELSQQWPYCLEGKARAFRVIGAFHQILARAAQLREADIVLIDVGPNLGAINRAALIAANYVAIPLAPDLFSLKGLQNLGPRLREWRSGWTERLKKGPAGLDLPQGQIDPLGYVVMQHAVRLDRPVKAYAKWMARIPGVYREAVLGEASPQSGVTIARDPHCLSTLKHYRSLMPLAQEAHKPMFFLKPADGAIGGHGQAVQDCYRDFRTLALEVAKRAGVTLP
ncbi:MAG: AAA family ATPase [Actinomycetes bacterium]|jgi:chromosome partitioning protein